MSKAPTVGCMTTYPPRYDMAIRSANRFAGQFDHLFLYANEKEGGSSRRWEDEVPGNVTVFRGEDEGGNLGDVGKFFPLRYITGQAYVFLLDDDIRYAPDYVEQMSENIDRFDREYVVGVHGYDVKKGEKIESFTEDGQVRKRHFAQPATQYRPVHVLGTGTVAFWSERVKMSLSDFPVQNMSDLFFARWCQREAVGMMMVPRSAGWLRPYPTPDEGLWGRFKGRDETQTWILNNTEWIHHARTPELS